jgi:hypothetical protein
VYVGATIGHLFLGHVLFLGPNVYFLFVFSNYINLCECLSFRQFVISKSVGYFNGTKNAKENSTNFKEIRNMILYYQCPNKKRDREISS